MITLLNPLEITKRIIHYIKYYKISPCTSLEMISEIRLGLLTEKHVIIWQAF
jgi:hypothetical protein